MSQVRPAVLPLGDRLAPSGFLQGRRADEARFLRRIASVNARGAQRDPND
jgi:hypothetical protein